MLTDDSIQSMGGKARADSLSAEQRSEIAKKAAEARWSIPKATHFGELDIVGIKIPCYVLEDGRRVLSQRGLQTSIGLSTGGGTYGAHRMAQFVERLQLKVPNTSDLLARINEPVLFSPTHGGRHAYGYAAEVLPEVCDYILACRDSGLMNEERFSKIVVACDALVRALAKVGIIALVDEATGYQEVRDRLALQKILEHFISKELLKWAKRFPDDFYKEMFRLKGWQWQGMKINRPSVVGHYTNDLVYDRLAPGVLEELRRINPPDEAGHRRHKHHQWLTVDVGHPKLRDHLNGVLALMRAAASWEQFKRMIDRAFPKLNTTMMLPFSSDEESI
jgi:hypothetical protein